MKKKFLSLMMAAAVVATTSVSAFASATETVTENDSTVEVKVNGIVNNHLDQAPAGTLSVTVPTALSFTVSSQGKFAGSDINVVNNGTQAVDVFAYQFIDTTPTTGIVVKNDLTTLGKRSDVGLRLNGNEGTAYFKSEENDGTNKGVYDEKKASHENGVKISTIQGSNNDTLYLKGDAGSDLTLDGSAQNDGINEKFTLRLKIKKSTTP